VETLSKFSDINAVLNKANDMLPLIEVEYQKCLKEEKIPDNLLVDIKDYLGNLRSALDYIWHKIPSVADGYFPIANSLPDFMAKTTKIDQQYSILLEKYQDYNQNSWIRCFSLFRNKNTHITLIPQKRIETPSLNIEHNGVGIRLTGGATIQMGRGAIMSLGGAVIPGGQIISANSSGIVGDPRLKVKREIWVDFIFDGSSVSPDFPQGVSALPFLKKSLPAVLDIIKELEKIL
jgi:hypothetical protein